MSGTNSPRGAALTTTSESASPASAAPAAPVVLVTDDSPSTVMVLCEMLEQAGLRVISAADGAAALALAARQPPDLILLDVIMPSLDGYATCRQLKASAPLQHIPVIFMTSLTDEKSKLQCFEAGGVDYIAKPLHLKEVLARVQTHLALNAMQKQLAQQNLALQREVLARAEVEASLEQLVARRTADLEQRGKSLEESLAQQRRMQEHMVKTEIMASLGRLVAGLAHEINAPVGVSYTAATQLGEELRHFRAAVEANQMTRSRLAQFTASSAELVSALTVNCARAAELVRRLKSGATDRSSEQRRKFLLGDVVRETMASLEPQLRKQAVAVQIEVEQEVMLDSYPGALSQVLINLTSNSLDHAFGAHGGQLDIRVAAGSPAGATLTFADNGCGIAAIHLPRVFEPFFSTRRDAGNSGLGMHIVASLVTATLGGAITIASQPGRGTVCSLTLPLAAP